MNITEIYNKYHLPDNLQMHMLRVAACSSFIIDHWQGKDIDKEAIIRVCLLHDMGNIVKIPKDYSDDKNFIEIRQKYLDKYGTNDHEINLKIGKIEGLSDKELRILDSKRSRKNEETLKSNSYEVKICAYCDQRVAPDGVVDLRTRLEDAKKRYKDKPLSVWSNEVKANHLIKCALVIEQQVIENCNISKEDINNKNIEKYIFNLRNYKIL